MEREAYLDTKAARRMNWQACRIVQVQAAIRQVIRDTGRFENKPDIQQALALLATAEVLVRGTAHDVMREDGRASAIGKRSKRSREASRPRGRGDSSPVTANT